jgi:putative DNA primase/helicase
LLGDFLCQVTERPLMQLRALGSSNLVRVANSFTVFANGNNLTVGSDVVRRTVQCALDADMEDPAARYFASNPVAEVLARRGDYVAACLTIARAYIVAGWPQRLPPLPSYEAWSDLVRGALVWLGYSDPVASTSAVRAEDPIRQARAAFFTTWASELGCMHGYRTAELIDAANTRLAWRDALLDIAAAKSGPERIDPHKLGNWLRNNADTIAADYKLIPDRSDSTRPRWRLAQTPHVGL